MNPKRFTIRKGATHYILKDKVSIKSSIQVDKDVQALKNIIFKLYNGENNEDILEALDKITDISLFIHSIYQ
jgi:hypothetical protein